MASLSTSSPSSAPAAAASVNDTIASINKAARNRGGYFKDYSCKVVSWDDCARGEVGGKLSCWGSNITDTRLYAKDGRSLFTVRSDNWNERLGKTTTSDIAVVADPETSAGLNPRPFTLKDILSSPYKFGGYAGLDSECLTKDVLDSTVSIRFQTTFLPVDATADGKSTLEFAPEAYNYNTTSDSDPKNLILLCTSQGLAIQQDGAGAKKIFHHSVTSENSKETKRYWLEAESSKHQVGGQQTETKEEREDAISRGKATASVIGVRGMGTRFNALMTIQIPLEQKEEKTRGGDFGFEDNCNLVCSGFMDDNIGDSLAYAAGLDYCMESCSELSMQAKTFSAAPKSAMGFGGGIFGGMKKSSRLKGRSAAKPEPPKIGKSSAARVSRGSEVEEGKENGDWKGLTVKEPKRHEVECITCTVVMYYTCEGGVPNEADVISAIEDLENMYKSVEDDGKLGDDKFDFMKKELTVKDVIDINKKIIIQPPPKPNGVSFWNIFPGILKDGKENNV